MIPWKNFGLRWNTNGDRAKAVLAELALRDLGAWFFTLKIRPELEVDLQAKRKACKASNRDFKLAQELADRMQKLLQAKFPGEQFYLTFSAEYLSRGGGSGSRLHVHGAIARISVPLKPDLFIRIKRSR